MLHAPIQIVVKGLQVPFFVVEKNLPSPDIMTAIRNGCRLISGFSFVRPSIRSC